MPCAAQRAQGACSFQLCLPCFAESFLFTRSVPVSGRPRQDALLSSCTDGLQSGGAVKMDWREQSRGGVSLEGDHMQRECTFGWGVGAHGCIKLWDLQTWPLVCRGRDLCLDICFLAPRSRLVNRFAGCRDTLGSLRYPSSPPPRTTI